MKKYISFITLICFSCVKDFAIPIGTGNIATTEISSISSISINSASVTLSVNYPSERTLKSVGIQSASFNYYKTGPFNSTSNELSQTAKVNFDIMNLSSNQNYTLTPCAEFSAGPPDIINNQTIRFLGNAKTFSTQPLPSVKGSLNFQIFKTNSPNYLTKNASDFDLYVADKPLINEGTISIIASKPNILNWNGFEELNSIVNSSLSGDLFAIVISGFFVPSESGTYNFSLEGSYIQELSLNGNSLINVSTIPYSFPIGTHTASSNLSKGELYELKIRKQHNTIQFQDALNLFWKKPSNLLNWIQDANELRSNKSGEVLSFTTVISKTGRIWMDRNLGASQVATSKTDDKAYGDLYQWGRGTDGHQNRNSTNTTILATSNQPGNSNFILGITNPTRDWLIVKNDNLWQGVNGLNNVCPTGFRLPTLTEWENEMNTWSPKNSDGAFNSPLKLPLGGIRLGETGIIDRVGIISNYYSSTTLPLFAGRINISDNVYTDGALRSDALSVRCIKD